jgi:predicted peptidase
VWKIFSMRNLWFSLEKTWWPLILALILTATFAPVHAATDPTQIPFVARTVTTSHGTYGYRVFVPAHWNGRRPCAVILFLHGSGERGSDNMAQTKNGIRLLIAQNPDQFPAVVVCPQCRNDALWTQPEMEEMALQALDQSVQEFHGDPARIYLTGLSLGGYGTWDLAERYPARWAAIAPCCGGIVFPPHPAVPVPIDPNSDPYRVAAEKVAHLPTWIFHGGADPTVPVSESRQMAALLFSMKADVRYTEYPGVGHNSWDFAYKEPDLISWFLSHKSSTH